MRNILTAALVTANLVCLQTLLQTFPVHAQSARDLQIEETVGLPENGNGEVEIPSVGGSQEQNANGEALLSNEIGGEDAPNDGISESEDRFFDVPLNRGAVSSCDVSGFPLIILCERF